MFTHKYKSFVFRLDEARQTTVIKLFDNTSTKIMEYTNQYIIHQYIHQYTSIYIKLYIIICDKLYDKLVLSRYICLVIQIRFSDFLMPIGTFFNVYASIKLWQSGTYFQQKIFRSATQRHVAGATSATWHYIARSTLVTHFKRCGAMQRYVTLPQSYVALRSATQRSVALRQRIRATRTSQRSLFTIMQNPVTVLLNATQRYIAIRSATQRYVALCSATVSGSWRKVVALRIATQRYQYFP